MSAYRRRGIFSIKARLGVQLSFPTLGPVLDWPWPSAASSNVPPLTSTRPHLVSRVPLELLPTSIPRPFHAAVSQYQSISVRYVEIGDTADWHSALG
jgi:hypothetical protein